MKGKSGSVEGRTIESSCRGVFGRECLDETRPAADFREGSDGEHGGAADEDDRLDEVGVDDRPQSSSHRVDGGENPDSPHHGRQGHPVKLLITRLPV